PSLAATSNRRMSLSTIGQIAITVHDVERAATFYRDTLGIPLLFQMPNMAFFNCGGIRLMLGLPEGTTETYSSIIYYKVADIQATAAQPKGCGVVFEQEPHVLASIPEHAQLIAFFRNPITKLLDEMSEDN